MDCRFPPQCWPATPGMFVVREWEPFFPAAPTATLLGASPLSIRTSPRAFDGWGRTATLVSNSQSVLRPLRRVATHAREMFEADAFVHQYEAHGFERGELAEAFEEMDQIVHNYQTLGT